MSLAERDADRLRWRCRRGMLELDLVLNAFLERHLQGLNAPQRAAFARLLDRIDPELLDLVMGREEGRDDDERKVLALMRAGPGRPAAILTPDPSSLTPALSPGGRRAGDEGSGDSCRERLMPFAQI